MKLALNNQYLSTTQSLVAIHNADNQATGYNAGSTTPSSSVTTGTAQSTTKENDGSTKSEKRVDWPEAPFGTIMGLPGIVRSGAVDQAIIFEQSFPIMTVKAFKMKKTDKNNVFTKGDYEDIPGGSYKFALVNEGGVSLSVSNNYGASTLEDQFSSIAENTFGILGEMKQFEQNDNLLGALSAKGLRNLDATVDQATANLYNKATDALKTKATDSTAQQLLKESGKTAADLLNMFGRAMFLGNRIDIPDVWKGSNGGLTANVKIDLRARSVGSWGLYDGITQSEMDNNSEEYESMIVTPIKILLALSCPLRKTDGETNGGGVTYENPPYLEVTIDKVFESRCCAISNLSIQFNYKETGYYKMRPNHVVVTFQLRDMYNVFVWDNKATANGYVPEDDVIPSSAMYMRRLLNPENGTPMPFMETSLLQGGSSVTGLAISNPFAATIGTFAEQLGSTTKALSNLVSNTIGTVTNAIDKTWHAVSYGLNSTVWNTVNNVTRKIDNDFSTEVFSIASSAGFDINNAVNSVNNAANTISGQTFGNFNMSAVNSLTSSVTSIPSTISSIFTGTRSEINNFVSKVSTTANTFKEPIKLLANSSVASATTDTDKIDKIYDIQYEEI